MTFDTLWDELFLFGISFICTYLLTLLGFPAVISGRNGFGRYCRLVVSSAYIRYMGGL